MNYTTTAQDAKAIRTSIKKDLGFGPKDVSVRSSNYSMGSSIRVSVKSADAALKLAEIEAIANPKESVRRCGYSGDILSGGNRFVFVNIDSQAARDVAARFIDPEALDAKLEEAKAKPLPTLIPVVDLGDDRTIYAQSPGGKWVEIRGVTGQGSSADNDPMYVLGHFICAAKSV